MNYFYFLLIIFALIFLCPINSSGKTIRFKVLWSIFEENADKINAYTNYRKKPLNRFRISLFRHNEKRELVPSAHTQKYDIYSVDIDEREQFIDVEVGLNAYGSNSVTKFEKLQYQEGRIFVLPFHQQYPLPILLSVYDESIFSKPVRHLHLSISARSINLIKPISIECVKSKTIWHFVDGTKELLIQHVVCDFDKYKYTYDVLHNNKPLFLRQSPRILILDEPIYELGFVNRYEIVHNMEGKVVSYGLKKEVHEIDFATRNFANQNIPYLMEYIREIGKIREIYLMQKKNEMMQPEAALLHIVNDIQTGQHHVLLPQLGRPEEEAEMRQQKRQKVHVGIQGHAQQEDHGETGESAHQQPELLELPSQPIDHGFVGAPRSGFIQNIQTIYREKQALYDVPIDIDDAGQHDSYLYDQLPNVERHFLCADDSVDHHHMIANEQPDITMEQFFGDKYSTPQEPQQLNRRSAIQQKADKGKAKISESSLARNTDETENVDSRLENVRREIAQIVRLINDQDEFIKKAYEERAKACENLECLQKIVEELEKEKIGMEGGPD